MREDQIIIGGQAVIEGVMMRAPHSYAVAVRRADGAIVTKSEPLPPLAEKYPLLKLPLLRGAAVLVQSMVLGIRSLNFSASVAFDEMEEKGQGDNKSAAYERDGVVSAAAVLPGGRVGGAALHPASRIQPLEETPADTSGKASHGAKVAGSLVFAILINIVLFILLPLLLTNMLFVYFGGGAIDARSDSGAWYADAWAWVREALRPVRPSVAFNVVDGLIRMAFFIAMITGFSLVKEIRRVFEFHGAEHKVVYTWEAGEDLTVENARSKRRQHPRCGTSFLMVVMLVAIGAFSVVRFDSLILNFMTRILLIPLIAGVSYEIIRASARSRTQTFLSVITRPGLWLQNVTTKEPDDSQLEVAIVALKESLALEPATGLSEPAGSAA